MAFAASAPALVPASARVTPQVSAIDISRSFGDRHVLVDVSLAVPPGARVGLIGENGVGKSTLLGILAGLDEPDHGTVTRPARTGHLRQELRADPAETLHDVLERALAEVRLLEHRLEEAGAALATSTDPDAAAERYASALSAAERADVWDAPVRRDRVLAGLGLSGIPLDRRIGEVSGGQRSRIAMAALLLERPDALLLDEPTNHLDDEAVDFLRRELVGWAGPVLFASHDRAFLDEVATELADLDPTRTAHASGAVPPTALTVYGGDYSDYLGRKAAERERWEQQFAVEQDELNRLRDAVATTARAIQNDRGPRDNDKMGYDFKGGHVQKQVARRVRNAQGRLDDLTAAQVRKPPAPLVFAGLPSGSHALEESADAAITAVGIRVADRLDVDRFEVGTRSRILVTGPNGAGKSTLLGVLAGDLRPDAGAVSRRRGLRVALLEQDVRFLDADESPRRLFETTVGASRAEAVPLGSLGLVPGRDLDRPIGRLSVGQQRRLALALIIARPPHVFLLDEPTNHLSLALATDLEEALGGYPGAVVVASHDRWLRSHWSGEEVALDAGRRVRSAGRTAATDAGSGTARSSTTRRRAAR